MQGVDHLWVGWVGHVGVGGVGTGVWWVMQGWGRSGVGWGGSCRGRVGHTGVGDCKIMNFWNYSNSRKNNSRDSKIHEWI